jgi:hypothetical protein
VTKTDIQCPCQDLPGIMIFVAPSTSGAASKFWNPRYWEDLAALVQSL